MGRTGSGVEVRSTSIRIAFVLDGVAVKKTLQVNGKPMKPTGPNIKFAERLAAEIRERIRYGTFSMVEYFPASGTAGTQITVAAQLATWLGAQRVEVSTRSGYSSACKFWREVTCDAAQTKPLGERPLRSLRHSDILTAIASRPDLKGKTINNYVSVLREAYALALRDGLVAASPVDGVPRAKQQQEPPDPFTQAEAAQIIADMQQRYPEQIGNLVEFWLRTGLRTSELAGLRWRNIDLASSRMVVREATVRGVEKRTTKTSVIREVRLDSAMPALLRQKARTFLADDHVFLDPRYGTPRNEERAFRRSYWTPTLKRLGLRYRRPYCCRHTRATEMLMAGMKPAFCAKQLGHSLEVFLKVYSRWIPGVEDDAEMAKLSSNSSLVLPQGSKPSQTS